MLPVGHATIGILTYAAVQLPRDRTDYGAVGVVAALLGSQFPDGVEKSPAYYQVLASGRSLGYSLLVLLGLVLYQLTLNTTGTARSRLDRCRITPLPVPSKQPSRRE